LEGIVCAHKSVIVKAPNTPYQIQCGQQLFVVGENENIRLPP
jgi:hypothetical protein